MLKFLYLIILSLVGLFIFGCTTFKFQRYLYAIVFSPGLYTIERINNVDGLVDTGGISVKVTSVGQIFPYFYLPKKQVTVDWTEKESGKRYVKTVEVNPPKGFTRRYGMDMYFYMDEGELFVAYTYAYNDGIFPKNRYKLPTKTVLDDDTEFDIKEYRRLRRTDKIQNIEEYKNWKKSQVVQ